MGRRPQGGQIELARQAVEEPASEIASRLTRLQAGNPLEEARHLRTRSLLLTALAEVDADIKHDREIENPHLEAAARLAYGLLDAIHDYRDEIRRADHAGQQELMERMLTKLERLAGAVGVPQAA